MLRVVITGYSLFTAFGFGREVAAEHLFGGTHGFKPIERFDPAPFRCSFGAEADFSGSLLELGMICAKEALSHASLSLPADAGIVIGCAGDFEVVHRFWSGVQRLDPSGAHLETARLSESLPGYHTRAIADMCGIPGTRTLTFNNACISSSNAIGHAYDLIQSGREHSVLCGGYSLINKELFAKFDAGMAFSRDGVIRPFSLNRSGLLLGDGGCMMVLEELGHALHRKATILAELTGWGLSSDAYHVSKPHPEGNGIAAAVTTALKRSEISPQQISYINAHATGSKFTDCAETNGIKQVFGDKAYDIPISSTKSMTGHLLQATGAVETAICLMALQEDLVPPTIGHEAFDPECDLDYVLHETRTKKLEYVLNVNSSFGGNNTALILRKWR
ncbi:3-oxoacyl-[acyl-carrier-protein] synthase II [Fontibacillus phaseoli]|uniref:3-oxoacyl-[acyl-carrier-protein] synthase II n=1 Tax=Fontibacillus phaseoli TaxID=1416533 RepID=A0A369B9R4_9BACL|nr:beta-ketoacyl-[acyl-carrier-protein] synthase family protein [Fontibacillus phaseoli]RCX17338.1 3-oxoacyl-[acyl-carrier-protein] synthase II [Fontibacillus phaseoli]